MKVRLTLDNRWIRTDYIRANGQTGRNLYHHFVSPWFPLLDAVYEAIEHTHYYYAGEGEVFWEVSPAYRNLVGEALRRLGRGTLLPIGA